MTNLDRCKAQQTLHTGNYDSTAMEHVYDLYMTAYGDERLAQRAKSRAAEAYADKMIADRRKAG